MSNNTIRSTLHQEESLVQKIRKQRLTRFGHVTRTEASNHSPVLSACYS